MFGEWVFCNVTDCLTPRAEVSYARSFMCASVMFVVRKIMEMMNCMQQADNSSASIHIFYGTKNLILC